MNPPALPSFMFNLGAEVMRSAHPNLHQQLTEEELQELLAEANEGVPEFKPTQRELDEMWEAEQCRRSRFIGSPHEL